MDANRDEALKCILLAKQYLAAGKVNSAKKFTIKARKLSPEMDLEELSNLLRKSPAPSPSRRSSTGKVVPGASPSPKRDKSQERHFTKSQAEAVRRVLSCKDYYKILDVSKDCTVDELKKVYRSLALKFHPDKNHAPGATEAFKKIGQAFNVLTDPEKRRRFDQYGTEDDSQPAVTRHRQSDVFYQYEGPQGFDAEVFNMFFNGGFPFSNVYRTQRHRPTTTSRESDRDNSYFVYIQLLPLLVLFGLSFFSSLFVKDPYYQLAQSQKYPIERNTNQNHIPYFVKTTFADDYDGSIPQLEVHVEDEYKTNLRVRCYQERERRETLMFQARFRGDNERFVAAKNMETPSCHRLIKLYG